MKVKEGTNKAGDKVSLWIEEEQFQVSCPGIAGYSSFNFLFDSAEDAEKFYAAMLLVKDYEAD